MTLANVIALVSAYLTDLEDFLCISTLDQSNFSAIHDPIVQRFRFGIYPASSWELELPKKYKPLTLSFMTPVPPFGDPVIPTSVLKLKVRGDWPDFRGNLFFPPNLTELDVSKVSNLWSYPTIFPDSIRSLSIRKYAEKTKLPPNLKELRIVDGASPKDIANLPNTLTHLFLCKEKVTHKGPPHEGTVSKWPAFLSVLHCPHLTKILTNLPSGLTKLRTGKHFDTPLTGLLPETLREVEFGDQFNQPISGILPPLLTHVVIGRSTSARFNHPLKELPGGLLSLKIQGKFNNFVDNLPESLQVLNLDSDFNRPISRLPPNLQKLVLGDEFDQDIQEVLPPSLEKLAFGEKFAQKLNSYFKPKGSVPNETKDEESKKDGEEEYVQTLGPPKCLKTLKLINKNYQHFLDFPKTLTELHFHANPEKGVAIQIPLNVKRLFLPMCDILCDQYRFPASVEKLHVRATDSPARIPRHLVNLRELIYDVNSRGGNIFKLFFSREIPAGCKVTINPIYI